MAQKNLSEVCGAKAVDATLDHKVNKIDLADCQTWDAYQAKTANPPTLTADQQLKTENAKDGGCDNKFCIAAGGNYTGGKCKVYNCDHQYDSDANAELAACYKVNIAKYITNTTCKA
eukprot:gene16895-5206_t